MQGRDSCEVSTGGRRYGKGEKVDLFGVSTKVKITLTV